MQVLGRAEIPGSVKSERNEDQFSRREKATAKPDNQTDLYMEDIERVALRVRKDKLLRPKLKRIQHS